MRILARMKVLQDQETGLAIVESLNAQEAGLFKREDEQLKNTTKAELTGKLLNNQFFVDTYPLKTTQLQSNKCYEFLGEIT